jgi:hypothetical protein
MSSQGGYRIAVLTHGWVLVGLVEDDHDEALVFAKAATIRFWGTKNGLGELIGGPLKETKTDKIPARVRVRPSSVLYTVDVSDAWAGVLA